MPPLLTLLLLTFLMVPVLSDTLFVITGYITCSSKSPFKYNMRVIEDDGKPFEDVLYTSGVQSSINSHSFFNITCQDSIDHVTNYYELAIRVLHNCNALVETKNSMKEFDLGAWPITHGTHYINYNINITDKGKPYKYTLSYWFDELEYYG